MIYTSETTRIIVQKTLWKNAWWVQIMRQYLDKATLEWKPKAAFNVPIQFMDQLKDEVAQLSA